MSAYEHLRQFGGSAPFGAWLTRIAVNEALGRLRHARRYSEDKDDGDQMDRFASTEPNPEQAAARSEVSSLLETLIDALPDGSRAVLVLRDVEGMSTAETSDALGITQENVKIRLHRARATLRLRLSHHIDRESRNAFVFQAPRCDRVVRHILKQLRDLSGSDDEQNLLAN